ncbi:hypothetical protein [Victivallis vadensis]|uniref:hypothetical protein n=1 Tax=Victivallis vadensis TaxID=172901 RepID=UPI00307E4961
MKIECPKCHQHYEIDESHIGQEIECGCGERIRILLQAQNSTPILLDKSMKLQLGNINIRIYLSKQEFICLVVVLLLAFSCGFLVGTFQRDNSRFTLAKLGNSTVRLNTKNGDVAQYRYVPEDKKYRWVTLE